MVSLLFDSLSRPIRLVKSIVHFRTVFSRATFLHDLLHHALECTDAVSALSMAGQSIVPRECVATETRVWFGAGVDLGVAL